MMKFSIVLLNVACTSGFFLTLATNGVAVTAKAVVQDTEKIAQSELSLRRVQDESGLFGVQVDSVDEQVIGGLHAPIGFFTHQVALYRPLEDGSLRFRCGGSLIAKNVILGAAQCVYNGTTGMYFGDDYVTQFTANLNQYYRFQENKKLEVHRICEVIVHPNFVFTEVSEYFDFVLFKLCEDSKLAKKGTIVPITLNKDYNLPTDHEVLTITGWGDTDPNESSPSNELIMVNVNYINNTECTTPPFLYPKEAITDDMMCAGALVGGGRDACGGDGGGPLIIQGNKYNNHLLVGITSWGFDNTCALPDYPGVYARVSYVIDWILEKGCSFIEGECDIETN